MRPEGFRQRFCPPLEQRCATGVDIVCGKQGVQAFTAGLQRAARVGLPGVVGQGGQRDLLRRAADGPWTQLVCQRAQQVCVGGHEAEPDAGQAEELADRAQHDQAGMRRMRGHAVVLRGVAKRFIHDQPAAARGQLIGPR